MRNLILTVSVILFSVVAFAQKRSDLKGPEYKNYKPWKHNNPPTMVYSVTSETKLMGPEYKNKKRTKNNINQYAVIKVGSERSKLKGPAYKNYKH